jgi:hypothetical protein
LTLVEVAMSSLVIALTFGSLATALSSSRALFESGSRAMSLEQDSGRALRKVVDALRGADAASLPLVPIAPLSASRIDFQTNEGYDGSGLAWSEPRRIELDVASGRLRWLQNPGEPSEQESGMAFGIPSLLEGETLNGLDDNGNGLIDEAGFCVTREGSLLVLRLTLQREPSGGQVEVRTTAVRLNIRN